MANSSSPEPVDLSDPTIAPSRLQELAQTHPHLWDEILRHPNVYPGLTNWIQARQADQAAAAPQESPSVGENEPETTHTPAEADASEVDEPAAEADQPAAEQPVDPVQESAPTSVWFEHDASAEPSPAEPTDTYQQPGQQAGQQPSSFGYPTPQQQPYGYDQPYGYERQYGYPQQSQQPQQPPQQPYYGQPVQYLRPARSASRIDLNSRRTWGLIVAGGAAFLSLFGFFFSPSVAGYGPPEATHLASGGWLMLVLGIATVGLALVDLLMSNQWTRYFFVVVGIGTGFALIGRYLALSSFLTPMGVGFSVVWIILMAVLIIAGTMVYLAPSQSGSPNGQQQSAQQYHSTGRSEAPYNMPPQPGYGPQQTQQYPQGGTYGGPQQPGGYNPPQ